MVYNENPIYKWMIWGYLIFGNAHIVTPKKVPLFGYDSDVPWFLGVAVNGDKYEPARICIFVANLLGYIQLSPSYLRLAMYIGNIDRPIIQGKPW